MKQTISSAWTLRAACLRVPTSLFFPLGENSGTSAQSEEAKAICVHCPVRITCLKVALDGNEAGIWGGMSENERRLLRSQMTPADYATEQALLITLTEKLPECEKCGVHRKEMADGLCWICSEVKGTTSAEVA